MWPSEDGVDEVVRISRCFCHVLLTGITRAHSRYNSGISQATLIGKREEGCGGGRREKKEHAWRWGVSSPWLAGHWGVTEPSIGVQRLSM